MFSWPIMFCEFRSSAPIVTLVLTLSTGITREEDGIADRLLNQNIAASKELKNNLKYEKKRRGCKNVRARLMS